MADNLSQSEGVDFAPDYDPIQDPDYYGNKVGNSDLEGLQGILNVQATRAVKNGADLDVVQKQLKDKTDQLAQMWQTYGPDAFKNVALPTGVAPSKTKMDPVQRADSAVLSDDDKEAVKRATDPGILHSFAGPVKNAYLDLASTALEFAPTVKHLLNPADALLPDNIKDAEDAQSYDLASSIQDYKKETQNLPPAGTAEKIAALGGNFVGGLATFGAGALGTGFDVIRNGGTLQDAAKAEGISIAQMAAQLATTNLGKTFLTRLGMQVPANVAIGAGARALNNEDPADPYAIAGDIGSGVLGSASPHGGTKKPPTLDDAPLTGDPGVDAGIQAGNTHKNVESARQFDLFDTPEQNQNEVGTRDMFSGQMQNATDVEANRQQQSAAYDHVSTNDNVSDPNADLFNDTQQRTDTQRQALDSGYLADQSPDFIQSENARVEQAATQSEFPFQDELQLQSKPEPVKTRGETARAEAVKADPSDVEEDDTPATKAAARQALLDKLGDNDQHEGPGFQTRGGNVADSIKEAAANGTLTGQHVLDAVADNHDNHFDNAPEARGLVDELRSAGKRLGGLDTTIERYDPSNPIHQDIVNRNEGINNRASAVFDAKTNKIIAFQDLTVPTMVHEVAHAVTARAYNLGAEGRLSGKAQAAYNTLSHLADTLLPIAKEHAQTNYDAAIAAGVDPAIARRAKVRTTYGTTDLHELDAELTSNPDFRNHLKSIKLDSIEASKLGFGRLVVGKVRNMYEGVVKTIRNIVGLSPKADNAFDALYSAKHSFLGSIDDSTANAIKDHNARNTTPDLSFLGEQAEARTYAKDRDDPLVTDPLSRLQQARATIVNTARGALFGKTPVQKEIRALSETNRNTPNTGLYRAQDTAAAVAKAQKAEGVSDDAIRKYMQAGNKPSAPSADMSLAERQVAQAKLDAHTAAMKGLDASPKTKAQVDAYKQQSITNEREIVRQALRNPNLSASDLQRYAHILDNPGYTFRGYQNENFSANVLRTANSADAALARGGKLSDAQQNAKTIRDNMISEIKENWLPTNIGDNTLMSKLKNMAKNVGIDSKQVMDGVPKENRRQALINALRDRVPDADQADIAANRLLKEAAGVIAKGASPVQAYLKGARLGDITKNRKEIPPALAALWGEVRKPASLVVQTLTKQSRAIADLKMQGDLRDAGLKGGWLHDLGKGEPPEGYTEPLRGKSFGALQNLRTTPEIKNLLNSQLELGTASKSFYDALMAGNPDAALNNWLAKSAVKAWTGLVGGTKLFRLATDPGYYLMYGLGGPSIMANHGIVDPRYVARGLVAHAAELSPAFRRSLTGKMADMVNRDLGNVVKSGMNESSMAGEMYNSLTQAKLKEALESGSSRSTAEALGHMITHSFGKAKSTANSALSLMDGYAKRAALFQRMDVLSDYYKRQGVAKSPEDIRAEAADWTKDTTATSNRSPVVARMLERFGGSQGLVYGVESIRNTMNAGLHGIADIKRGYTTNDPILAAHGFKQLAGVGVSVGLMHGMINGVLASGYGLAGMMGLQSQAIAPEDKKQEYLQQEKGPFRGMRPQELSDPNNPDKSNKFYWAPADRNDYFYQISQPLHVIMDAVHKQGLGQKVDWNDESKKAVEAFTSTFFNNSMVKKLINTAKGNDPSFYKDAPDVEAQKIADIQNSSIAQKLGIGEKGAKSILSLEDIFGVGLNRNSTVADATNASPAIKTLMKMGLGVKIIPNDTGLAGQGVQGRNGTYMKAALTEAKQPLDEVLDNSPNFDSSTIENAYKNSFKQTYKQLKMLKQDFDFAKANNVPIARVMDAAEDAGLPDDAVDQVRSGKLNPADLLDKDLDAVADKEADVEKDPKKVKAIYQKYTARQKQMDALYNKYSKYTPEQIEGM